MPAFHMLLPDLSGNTVTPIIDKYFHHFFIYKYLKVNGAFLFPVPDWHFYIKIWKRQ